MLRVLKRVFQIVSEEKAALQASVRSANASLAQMNSVRGGHYLSDFLRFSRGWLVVTWLPPSKTTSSCSV